MGVKRVLSDSPNPKQLQGGNQPIHYPHHRPPLPLIALDFAAIPRVISIMWRFRLFGYPVVVEWTFWIIALLLGISFMQMPGRDGTLLTLMWVSVVFISVIWHELGHALARKRFGAPYSEIRLYSFGGLCSGPGQFTRWESFFVSAAGPAASFLLGSLTWLIGQSPAAANSWISSFVGMMWMTNIYWAILNILPIFPLDGGQMFAAIMANKNPQVVYRVGIVVAVAVAIFALTSGSLWGAILFGTLAYSNYQRSKGLAPHFM